ncbi:MAG TPA: hypothetical protein VKB05_09160 [Pyrinomonadaceae bacterium]|nr:hypothetical protein [Pyrinomonadaceae bacterium]
MKKVNEGETNFFVDEFGDPVFYDKKGRLIVGSEGCSLLLGLGFVEIVDPRHARKAILALQQDIVNDLYLNKIPSVVRHTSVALHAAKDVPEVRYLMYQLIKTLDFKAQFVVSCKSEKAFRELHNSDENLHYDRLVGRLFSTVLHRFKINRICFSSRGSRARRLPLEQAIYKAKHDFEEYYGKRIVGTSFQVQAQSPAGEPCLSIIDYVAWALQRAYIRGESRYFEYIEDKVSYICDLREGKTTRYSRKNRFDINRAALLQLGSS